MCASHEAYIFETYTLEVYMLEAYSGAGLLTEVKPALASLASQPVLLCVK